MNCSVAAVSVVATLLCAFAPAADAQGKDGPQSPTVFTCSPKKLSRRDALTLTFGVPHPVELAVIRPDGAYFFIAQRRLSGTQASGMPSELFAGIAKMSIVPGAFKAEQWSKNAPDSEPVFTRPGKYRFVLANELESEDYGATQACEVTILD